MIEWNDSLLVGIKSIDEQHKNLFERFKQLMDAMRSGKGRKEIVPTIEFLEKYVIQHFEEEEEVQVRYHYPKYNEQKAQHDMFRKKLDGLKKQLSDEGASLSLIIVLQKEMMQWLTNHIANSDKELGNFLQSNGYK